MSAAQFEADASRRPVFGAALPRGLAGTALPVAMLAAAIVWQCVLALDCDVSWLLTVGERFLDGRRIYVDIQEVNPPASFLIYLPALVAARATGVSAEFATAASVFLLGVAAIVAAGRLLLSAACPADRTRRTFLALAAVLAFLLMPVTCFAQREHVAVLTLLPFLAIVSAQSDGRRVGWRTAVLAGLGAGVTIAIKPHFACAVVLPAAYLVWRRRSPAALAVSTIAAGAVVAAYAACVALVFPAFLDKMLPLAAAVYLPVRDDLATILARPSSLLFLTFAGLGLWQARETRAGSLAKICMLAAAGFFFAMLVQGKGYLNHVYPAVALGAFATADILLNMPDRHGARFRFVAGGLVAMALAALVTFGNVTGYPGLVGKVAAMAPPHPRIIAVASNLDVGHALTRQVGGEWVGRRCSLWVTANAGVLRAVTADPAAVARLRGLAEDDARMFAEDVRAAKPDIVLVDEGSGKDWIGAHPAVAEALGGYRSVASVAGIALWRPQRRAEEVRSAPPASMVRQ